MLKAWRERWKLMALVRSRQRLLEIEARELLDKAEPLKFQVQGLSGVIEANREQALDRLNGVIDRLRVVDRLSERVDERLRTKLSVASFCLSILALMTSVAGVLIAYQRLQALSGH
jgi:hypothetical protein